MLFISSVPVEISYKDSIDYTKIEQQEDRGRPITQMTKLNVPIKNDYWY